MKKILFLLSGILLLSSIAFADTFTFVQISDVHIPQKDVIKYEGRSIANAESNFKRAISAINDKEEIEYVFFTGDSVDRSNKEVFIKFFELVSNLNKPYYLTLGNHDINSKNGLNKKEVLKLLNEKTPYKQESESYYVELNSDFVAFFLDGTFDEGISSNGYFKKSTLIWLDEKLQKFSNKNVLIFQHFPVVEPRKEKFYKYPHNIINKKEYVKLLKKHKNIVLICSGHYHAEGEYKKYGIRHYSTPALFNTPSKYRYVQIDYDKNNINRIDTRLIENY